jgi:hypothetical protein
MPCKPAPRDTPSRGRLLVALPAAPDYRNGQGEKMPIRLKKLIGTVLLVTLVIVYAIVATIVAVAQLSQSGPLAHFAFFLLGGLVWILPAMGIIKWMMLPPKP